MINKSIILQADSYKYSQYCQTPPNTEIMYAYIESRGGAFDETIFFGLQMFLKETLSKPITQADIDEAEPIILAHGEPFYREGWEYILKEYGGYLPIKISAVPEGKLIPVKNVLAVIENTDPKCWWLPSFIETPTLRAVWYPTTVATNSYQIKKLINSYLIKNGDPAGLEFMLQDFGNRGVSSWESSGIGGCAHLVNFKGTDTVTALLFAKEYYDCEMAGYSVKASEHNSHITWGREGELESYRNMIRTGKPGEIISIVSDSYDIYEACKMFGTVLKDEIISSGIKLVVRPDCYSEDTKIFTKDGWIYFKDINEDTLVAQVEDDGTHTFIKPIKITKQEYNGKMHHYKDHHGKVDFLVTPNHRMIYKEHGKWKENTAETLCHRTATKKFYNSAAAQDKKKSLSFIERLNIAFQADGSYLSGDSSKNIRFSFSKQRKIDRLSELLKSNNIEYKIYSLKDGRYEFNIKLDSSLVSKNFDWVDTSDLCSNWCKEFIEELSHWDACIRNSGRIKYDSTNFSVIPIIEHIAICAGYGTLVSSRSDDRKIHFSDIHTIHIVKNCQIVGSRMKKEIVDYNGYVYCVTVPTGRLLVKRNRATLVCGNSGIPTEVVPKCLKILDNYFGHTNNSKGSRVLNNNIKVLQGDGINYDIIKSILYCVDMAGYSTDNLVFGMGGALLQAPQRDDQKFAQKCSAVRINGEWKGIYKDPITDKGKVSKKGRVTLFQNNDGRYYSGVEDWMTPVVVPVFENGKILKTYTFDEVRKNANESF